MNIEIIIDKITKTAEACNKNLAEIVAMTSSGLVYFNYTSEVIHSLFAVVTAVVSYIAVRGCKYLINKWNEKDKR